MRGWCHNTELTLLSLNMDRNVHSGYSVLLPGSNVIPPGVPTETYESTVAQLQPQCPSHLPSLQVCTLLLAMVSSPLVGSNHRSMRGWGRSSVRAGEEGMLGWSLPAGWSPRQFSICCHHAVTGSEQVWHMLFKSRVSVTCSIHVNLHWFSSQKGGLFPVVKP